MSAVATPERAPVRERGTRPRTPACAGPSPFDDRATLESVVLSAWEGVVVEGRCACLVCGGEMRAQSPAASCTKCGSKLN